MAETVVHGPLVSAGSLLNNTINPWDGPSIDYQGSMFPDPRISPISKDGIGPGRIKGFPIAPSVTLVDAIPSANSTATIAAAQAPSTTAGIALTLITAQVGTAAGVPVPAPGIPIIPVGTSTATTVLAIDFGFATGTTVANSTTVVVDDNSKFALGQWLVIPGVGGTTNRALFTQVQSISTNTTVITILPAAQTAGSHLPIGQANLYSQLFPYATQFGTGSTLPTAAEPYRLGGVGLAFDPMQGVARALTVQAASVGSGSTTLTVSGYDIWGAPMTEALTATGTTIVNGKKAFKYISNIVTSGTAATSGTPANVQVGLSDVFGLNLRGDKFEYLDIRWNGCVSPTSAGFTAALSTTSTATTADVRGTVNASTLNVATVASTNGARRLTIVMSVPLSNMLNATPLSTSSLFGTAQV